MTSLTPISGGTVPEPGSTGQSSAAILERFERLHPKEIDLSLDRVLRLLEALGNPHQQLSGVVHVAGTNGKGSTIAYMRAMLEAAGKRVHAFTSPHLVRFHERIVLNGQPISEDLLCNALLTVEAANAGEPITFFEITTVAAFLAFSQVTADFVLLETGLGGRLDATNVIDKPALTVITPISYDHERFLGSDLAGIAFEKAGILKKGVPCIVSRQESAALDVIEKRARELDAPMIIQGQSWDAFEQHGRLVFQTDSSLLDLPLPQLAGRHQLDNAGAAIAALRALDVESIETNAVAQGLRTVRWPARLQNLTDTVLQNHVSQGSEIWLDGGHNEAAGKMLARAMADMEDREPLPLHLVCGMMTGKDATGFFKQFATLAGWAGIIPIPGQKNTYKADELAELACKAGLKAEPMPGLIPALEATRSADGHPSRILICGSLYLAGEVLTMLETESPSV